MVFVRFDTIMVGVENRKVCLKGACAAQFQALLDGYPLKLSVWKSLEHAAVAYLITFLGGAHL